MIFGRLVVVSSFPSKAAETNSHHLFARVGYSTMLLTLPSLFTLTTAAKYSDSKFESFNSGDWLRCLGD